MIRLTISHYIIEKAFCQLTSAQHVVVQCCSQQHLSTADHAAPTTVGREESVGDGREVGAIRHPREGVVVFQELDDVRGDTLPSQLIRHFCGIMEYGGGRLCIKFSKLPILKLCNFLKMTHIHMTT